MREIIDQFDDYIIDLWGVLWDATHPFPDAIEFCRRLMAEPGKRVFFLTNTAEHCPEQMVERLREVGLDEATEERLVSSAQAAGLWLQREGLTEQPIYVVGGDSVWENVRRAGAEPIPFPDDYNEMRHGARSGWCVIGGLLNFEWSRLSLVISGIHVGGLRVLLPNPDTVVVSQDGRISLPAGMTVRVIESALPSVPVTRIGKPYPFIYDYAFDRMGNETPRSKVLAIGDSLATDIRGANEAGIASLLLGQGVHAFQSLEQILEEADERQAWPDFFVPRLAPDVEVTVLDGQRSRT